MSNPPPADRQRRAPELRLPYPFLEYLLELPGDYAKLTLRLLQRAQWVPTVPGGDVSVDAGEVLLSLRSRDIWGAVQLDRDVDEAGRVSLLRRVLARLERDAMIAVRPAHRTDTPQGTRSDTRRDTPATIVRFLSTGTPPSRPGHGRALAGHERTHRSGERGRLATRSQCRRFHQWRTGAGAEAYAASWPRSSRRRSGARPASYEPRHLSDFARGCAQVPTHRRLDALEHSATCSSAVPIA